jgi:TatD DNase family protein
MSIERPEYIDVHAHLNFKVFNADRDEVIKRTLESNTWVINVGAALETSKVAVEMAEKYEKGVYAIVGLHPTHVTDEEFDMSEFEKLVAHPKTVGVGETGIDVFRLPEKYQTEEGKKEVFDLQEKVFKMHIELAVKYNKPIMIHARGSYGEILEILERDFINKGVKLRGDVHFFAGTIDEAQRFMDIGFTVSFTGVITFADDYRKTVEYVPLDKMLSETDCPYVTPAPFRGQRNEPLHVREVVKKIAEIKGVELEEVKKALVSNAFSQFSL